MLYFICIIGFPTIPNLTLWVQSYSDLLIRGSTVQFTKMVSNTVTPTYLLPVLFVHFVNWKDPGFYTDCKFYQMLLEQIPNGQRKSVVQCSCQNNLMEEKLK